LFLKTLVALDSAFVLDDKNAKRGNWKRFYSILFDV